VYRLGSSSSWANVIPAQRKLSVAIPNMLIFFIFLLPVFYCKPAKFSLIFAQRIFLRHFLPAYGTMVERYGRLGTGNQQ